MTVLETPTELMQAGTESDYTSGAQQNYLFYEVTPAMTKQVRVDDAVRRE